MNFIAPLSMVFAFIAIVTCLFILMLISLTKQLHTVTRFLTCNTCIASILYCIVQCNNYIYLLFITWDTSDQSCRWRGYFGYLAIVAVVYSYLLQAISRFFFTILSTKYPSLKSLKTHLYLIIIEWIVVFVLPLPALVTKDIFFRPNSLCWVPKKSMLHVAYTVIVYYLIPILIMIGIYVSIYIKVRNNAAIQSNRRRQNRDLEVFRNIMILFTIYILGGIPSILYILIGIHFLYSVGIVSLTFAVTVEKFATLLLDREIRNIVKNFFCHRTMRVTPMKINIATLPQ